MIDATGIQDQPDGNKAGHAEDPVGDETQPDETTVSDGMPAEVGPEDNSEMPTIEQLDAVAAELDDVETVLSSIDASPDRIDAMIETAKAEGTIDDHPVLSTFETARRNNDR